MYFRIYPDNIGEWRWHLKSANGNTIADSGEGYINKKDCLKGIHLVMGTNNNTPIYEQEAKSPGARLLDGLREADRQEAQRMDLNFGFQKQTPIYEQEAKSPGARLLDGLREADRQEAQRMDLNFGFQKQTPSHEQEAKRPGARLFEGLREADRQEAQRMDWWGIK